ncbi:hypothetical protein NPIL_215921 [Nephila pilipes]|uniref:Uncharacterized protein n=1 Tax=Nephila pilipes TaxID=299642 RepID=A0A8X6NEH5_NEPPI|nr:hypothetical protein NPIL_215921 [Nephila pilipes]
MGSSLCWKERGFVRIPMPGRNRLKRHFLKRKEEKIGVFQNTGESASIGPQLIGLRSSVWPPTRGQLVIPDSLLRMNSVCFLLVRLYSVDLELLVMSGSEALPFEDRLLFRSDVRQNFFISRDDAEDSPPCFAYAVAPFEGVVNSKETNVFLSRNVQRMQRDIDF